MILIIVLFPLFVAILINRLAFSYGDKIKLKKINSCLLLTLALFNIRADR
ncbi:hypothetical protein T296_21470 [Pantoea agglomerans Eh318]|nr:hypothetical protein T296_21470 [Pantoea agglomerans Eh318]